MNEISKAQGFLYPAAAAVAAFGGICAVSLLWDSRRFIVRKYEVRSDRIRRRMRIAYLSDLHEKVYGQDNREVAEAVRKAAPDLILVGGDTIVSMPALHSDADDPSWYARSKSLLTELTSVAPVYFADGNHEMRLKICEAQEGTEHYGKLQEVLRETGVVCLHNRHAVFGDVALYGLELTERYYRRFAPHRLDAKDVERFIGSADKERFVILLAHDPEYFPAYAGWGADLTLSGHLHGGIMRLPWVGGVVSPNPALFPKYNGGMYRIGGRTQIVTCGLGEHTLPIRVFNPGEISMIDLVPAEQN